MLLEFREGLDELVYKTERVWYGVTLRECALRDSASADVSGTSSSAASGSTARTTSSGSSSFLARLRRPH
eukprot:14499578-Alexandrium_andersonii.AAC.1